MPCILVESVLAELFTMRVSLLFNSSFYNDSRSIYYCVRPTQMLFYEQSTIHLHNKCGVAFGSEGCIEGQAGSLWMTIMQVS